MLATKASSLIVFLTLQLQLPHDNEKLEEIYDIKDSKCAAWVFPYRVFDFKAVGMSVPYSVRIEGTILSQNF